jgi:hypothetical protein
MAFILHSLPCLGGLTRVAAQRNPTLQTRQFWVSMDNLKKRHELLARTSEVGFDNYVELKILIIHPLRLNKINSYVKIHCPYIAFSYRF